MVTNAFDTYCSAVCVMVRQKRCHALITSELTAHMEDHADALLAKGADPDEATRAAVAAMGDPYEVGKQLDKLHSPWYPRLTRVFTVLAAVFFLSTLIVWLLRAPDPPVLNPAELLQEGRYNSDTVLTMGRATGGGQLGAYTFSNGAAALCKYTSDGSSPTYRLKFVLPSRTACFWLTAPELYWVPSRLDNATYTYLNPTYTNAHGLFNHFSSIWVEVAPPFRSTYTFEFGSNGDVSYTVTLEEVPSL